MGFDGRPDRPTEEQHECSLLKTQMQIARRKLGKRLLYH